MAQVEVLVGSPSDLHFLWNSELLARLKEAGVTYRVSACSAHRNAEELRTFMGKTMGETSVYVCAAGWAAALPGAVKAALLGRSLATVYGVALPSDAYPDAADALLSIRRLPPGIEVICPDEVGSEGFDTITRGVLWSVDGYDPGRPDQAQLEAARAKIKPPWFDIPDPVRGKTKQVIPVGPFEVNIINEDDITAGDGAQHDVIAGKGAASTRHTCNVFEMLEQAGVPTHFVKRVDANTFRARCVQMIPLELIVRRFATGSYRDRNAHLPDGHLFDELVFEVFEKNDAAHDPLLIFDFASGTLRRYVPNTKAAEALGGTWSAGDFIADEPLAKSKYSFADADLLEQLRVITLRVFELIEEAWAKLGGVYIDFKIECGFDVETGELLVADVIDSDSGRLRFGPDGEDFSKETYRQGGSLPEVKRKFDQVAKLTDQFVLAA